MPLHHLKHTWVKAAKLIYLNRHLEPAVGLMLILERHSGSFMPSLWPSRCAPSFHQAHTSGSPVAKDGDKTNQLPRQHSDNVRIQGASSSTYYNDWQPAIECGVFL